MLVFNLLFVLGEVMLIDFLVKLEFIIFGGLLFSLEVDEVGLVLWYGV